MNNALKTAIALVATTAIIATVVAYGFWSFGNYHLSDEYRSKVTQEAVKNNNSSICEKIIPGFMEDRDPATDCYVDVAVQNHNVNACVNDKYTFGNSTCFFGFFERLPTDDLTICAVFQNQEIRDECYFEQHLFKKSKSICSAIQDSQRQQLCLSSQ